MGAYGSEFRMHLNNQGIDATSVTRFLRAYRGGLT